MTRLEKPARPRLADVGVFGGSGFYSLLDDAATEVIIDTPWGPPSAPITIGSVHGVRAAFLPRHGRTHELPPHRVNYRANVAAMRQLGVEVLFAPFAAGSLQPHIRPGDLVVVDQLIDRTSGRAESYHDDFDDGPQHVSFADPYDADLGTFLVRAAREQGMAVHDRGTVVVVNGPRFSTRAESSWFQSFGWEVVNMTQHPEAVLAREAGLRYAGIALVTDYDAGLAGDQGVEPVTQEAVFAFFEENVHRLREVLLTAIAQLSEGRGLRGVEREDST